MKKSFTNSITGDRNKNLRARLHQVAERRALESQDGPIGPPAPDPQPPAWANAPRLIPAARLCLTEGIELTALPRDRTGWARLCRLISTGRLRAEKGTCRLTIADLLENGGHMALLLHPPRNPNKRDWARGARRLIRRYGADMHLLMASIW